MVVAGHDEPPFFDVDHAARSELRLALPADALPADGRVTISLDWPRVGIDTPPVVLDLGSAHAAAQAGDTRVRRTGTPEPPRPQLDAGTPLAVHLRLSPTPEHVGAVLTHWRRYQTVCSFELVVRRRLGASDIGPHGRVHGMLAETLEAGGGLSCTGLMPDVDPLLVDRGSRASHGDTDAGRAAELSWAGYRLDLRSTFAAADLTFELTWPTAGVTRARGTLPPVALRYPSVHGPP